MISPPGVPRTSSRSHPSRIPRPDRSAGPPPTGSGVPDRVPRGSEPSDWPTISWSPIVPSGRANAPPTMCVAGSSIPNRARPVHPDRSVGEERHLRVSSTGSPLTGSTTDFVTVGVKPGSFAEGLGLLRPDLLDRQRRPGLHGGSDGVRRTIVGRTVLGGPSNRSSSQRSIRHGREAPVVTAPQGSVDPTDPRAVVVSLRTTRRPPTRATVATSTPAIRGRGVSGGSARRRRGRPAHRVRRTQVPLPRRRRRSRANAGAPHAVVCHRCPSSTFLNRSRPRASCRRTVPSNTARAARPRRPASDPPNT